MIRLRQVTSCVSSSRRGPWVVWSVIRVEHTSTVYGGNATLAVLVFTVAAVVLTLGAGALWTSYWTSIHLQEAGR